MRITLQELAKHALILYSFINLSCHTYRVLKWIQEKTKKFGFKKFKWRQKQFNKKNEIAEKLKLGHKNWMKTQNTITNIHHNLTTERNEK